MYLRPKSHLSYEEVTNCYRTCSNIRQKSYWHVIWLMSHPDHPQTVVEAVRNSGYSSNWVRELVQRYNAEGPDGLIDKRLHNPGQAPLLTDAQRTELSRALLGPAPDGGLWTGSKVQGWVEARVGTRPGETTGLNYLHDLRFALQQPRPSNTSAATLPSKPPLKKAHQYGSRSQALAQRQGH
jgi:transposase